MKIRPETTLFTVPFGSHLYGTNGPTSDIDVKAVCLPALEDLLLNKKLTNRKVKPSGDDGKVLPGETVAGEGKEADLQQSVERINQSLTASNQGIEFSVDADSERVIVKVVDRETREVLRQMPTQEALDIAKALDRTQGLLIRQEA